MTRDRKSLVEKFEEAAQRPVSDEHQNAPSADGFSGVRGHPTKDDNPQHREDFSRLLYAAASGNKSSPEKS